MKKLSIVKYIKKLSAKFSKKHYSPGKIFRFRKLYKLLFSVG